MTRKIPGCFFRPLLEDPASLSFFERLPTYGAGGLCFLFMFFEKASNSVTGFGFAYALILTGAESGTATIHMFLVCFM
jgi:hypothetical protein